MTSTTDNRADAGRRQFLRSALGAAGFTAALPALQGLGVLQGGRAYAAPGAGDYGPLIPTADQRDGVIRIALPEGFSYRTLGIAGQPMTDGNLTPLAHDGMAAFNVDGRIRLVRNHEDRNGPGEGTVAIDANAYDKKGGGTTTLVINPFTRQVERDFVSLSGTTVNCAGGPTPWGTWISCEETNVGATPTGWTKQHGYCFEVPAASDTTTPAVALTAMGRFAHEAVAVDPATGHIYETEDNGNNSGFYRFIPNTPGVLANGGQLEMLALDGLPQHLTYTNQTVGVARPASWVPIANPNPAGTSSTAVFNQGLVLGGAKFGRLEGCWYGEGAIYFTATSGGNAGCGQVWEFRPEGDGGWLTLIFESPNATVLDAPDNLTVTPNNALLICEDGGGEQYLRGVTIDGGIFDFGLNLQNEYEWAGATFAIADPAWNDRKIRGDNRPLGNHDDRITLFVNCQGATRGATPPSAGNEGLTFAIWGPWSRGAF